MNGKKSRMLRKQAGGNDGGYMSKSKAYPNIIPVKLSQNCSRKKYKDLKYLYKLVGV